MSNREIQNNSELAGLTNDHRQIFESRSDSNKGSTKHIKKGYLFALLMTMSIGTIQFGYSIGSWNTAFKPYEIKQDLNGAGWVKVLPNGDIDHSKADTQQTIVQSVTTAGSAFGALMSGFIMGLGRWKCIMLMNLTVIIGGLLTLVDNVTIFIIGRALYGIAAGGYSVFCPKYISEVSPSELKGPLGCLTQICITFGIIVPYTLGVIFEAPNPQDKSTVIDEDYNPNLEIYILFAFPVVLAVLQSFLMVTIFKYDTPQVMKQNNDYVSLREFMSKIYHPLVVQKKIDELGNNQHDTSAVSEDIKDIGYGEACCSPQYSRASWVGCTLAIFQQFTGINFIMFYSNTIFSSLGGISPDMITFLVGVVNFLATFGGLVLLFKYGRRQIMLVFNLGMAIVLFLVGFFSLKQADWTGTGDESNPFTTPSVTLVLVFIAFFEFSSGPITWLYMSEIMQDKTQSVATVLNWMVNLVISLITPKLIDAIGQDNIGFIFMACGILTLFGTVFMYFFMIETKGLSPQEIEEKFAKAEDQRKVNQELLRD